MSDGINIFYRCFIKIPDFGPNKSKQWFKKLRSLKHSRVEIASVYVKF